MRRGLTVCFEVVDPQGQTAGVGLRVGKTDTVLLGDTVGDFTLEREGVITDEVVERGDTVKVKVGEEVRLKEEQTVGLKVDFPEWLTFGEGDSEEQPLGLELSETEGVDDTVEEAVDDGQREGDPEGQLDLVRNDEREEDDVREDDTQPDRVIVGEGVLL